MNHKSKTFFNSIISLQTFIYVQIYLKFYIITIDTKKRRFFKIHLQLVCKLSKLFNKIKLNLFKIMNKLQCYKVEYVSSAL